MNTTTNEHTIAALIAHIVSECSPVDREAAYDEYLNTQGPVRVAGLTFEASEIIKECDPTAYRCGVNDFADSEEWTEIEGETYRDEDIEKARGEFLDGLNDELSYLQSELEELEEDYDENDGTNQGTTETIEEKKAEISALETFISEVERHSF